jgi:ferredoxin
MEYSVTIRSTGIRFEVASGESILQAAQRQGVLLPCGCHNGICGVCLSEVIEGRIEYPQGQPFALCDEDAEAGKALCCVGHPCSDLVLEPVNPDIDWEPWD